MSFRLADRVKDTAASITGIGSYTLNGAPPTGFQSFNSGVGDGATCVYCATDNTNWEVCVGAYTNSTKALTRVICLESSNAGALVSWAAATPTIFVVDPAELAMGLPHPGWVAGRFYPINDTVAFATATPALNTAQAVAIFIPDFRSSVILNQEITVVAGAGGLVRLGLYDIKDGQPNNLLVDSGTIATDGSTGAKQFTATGLTLHPGMYAIAANFSVAAPTIRTRSTSFITSAYMGMSSGTDVAAKASWTNAVGSGALPVSGSAWTISTTAAPALSLGA